MTMVGKLLWINRLPDEAEIAERNALLLAEAKTAARAEIVAIVGEVRLRLVTPLPGQDSIYTAKQAEAARYLAIQPEPDALDGFPFMRAEVGKTAPTARDLAQLWLNLAHIFAEVGAATEGLRKTADAAVEAARDPDQVADALTTLRAALAKLLP